MGNLHGRLAVLVAPEGDDRSIRESEDGMPISGCRFDDPLAHGARQGRLAVIVVPEGYGRSIVEHEDGMVRSGRRLDDPLAPGARHARLAVVVPPRRLRPFHRRTRGWNATIRPPFG